MLKEPWKTVNYHQKFAFPQLGNKFAKEITLFFLQNEKHFLILITYKPLGYNLSKIQLVYIYVENDFALMFVRCYFFCEYVVSIASST